jgi:small conductance mechanosensitive channel
MPSPQAEPVAGTIAVADMKPTGIATALQNFFDQMVKTVGNFAPSVIGALVFFVLAWIASGMFSRLALAALTRAKVEITIAKFLATLVRWTLISLSTVACLGMFGVNIAAFAAVLGAVGLAIGLALQGSLSNLAAGVMLLLFRPFKVGDAISVSGQAGNVDEIELFSTRLDTPDNRRIIIPNSTAFNAIVENTSHHPLRRVDINVGVDFSSDIPTTRRALTAALDSVPEVVDDPASAVVLVRFGKSAIEWQVCGWCKRENYGPVQQALMQNAQDQLNKVNQRLVPML